MQDPPSPLSKYVAEQVTLHLGHRLERLEADSAKQKEEAKKESEMQAKNAATVTALRCEAKETKSELAALKVNNTKLSDRVAGQERSIAAMKKDHESCISAMKKGHDSSMAEMQKAISTNTGLLRAHGEVLRDGNLLCLSGRCTECLLAVPTPVAKLLLQDE